jgi:hypothetical protein
MAPAIGKGLKAVQAIPPIRTFSGMSGPLDTSRLTGEVAAMLQRSDSEATGFVKDKL